MKTEDGQVIAQVTTHRDVLLSDVRAVPFATAMSWPALKGKIDRDLDDSRTSSRTASAHIKHAPR